MHKPYEHPCIGTTCTQEGGKVGSSVGNSSGNGGEDAGQGKQWRRRGVGGSGKGGGRKAVAVAVGGE